MAQSGRVCKSGIVMLTRKYGTQRQQRNYYDILNISPSASQKEIREAFIKLSKKMHPDVCGKDGHADYVKVNEAYTTLSKEDQRRQYDMNLHYCNTYNDFRHYYPNSTVFYRSSREYEEAMGGFTQMRHRNYNHKPNSKGGILVCIIAFLLGVLIHAIMIAHYMNVRKKVDERTKEYAEAIEKARRAARSRTPEEQTAYLMEIYNQANNKNLRSR